NTRMTATARLDLVDAFGHIVKSLAPRELPDLLPHDVTTVAESWNGLPVTGVRLHARVSLDAGDASLSRDTRAFWHVPVSLIAVAVLAIAALVILVRTVVRGVTRRRPTLVPA